MRNAGLEDAKAGIKIAERNKNNLRYADDTTLMAESEEFNMLANLETSAVATGLEKVSFNSNFKERQCQRMLKLPHNFTHLTC